MRRAKGVSLLQATALQFDRHSIGIAQRLPSQHLGRHRLARVKNSAIFLSNGFIAYRFGEIAFIV